MLSPPLHKVNSTLSSTIFTWRLTASLFFLIVEHYDYNYFCLNTKNTFRGLQIGMSALHTLATIVLLINCRIFADLLGVACAVLCPGSICALLLYEIQTAFSPALCQATCVPINEHKHKSKKKLYSCNFLMASKIIHKEKH